MSSPAKKGTKYKFGSLLRKKEKKSGDEESSKWTSRLNKTKNHNRSFGGTLPNTKAGSLKRGEFSRRRSSSVSVIEAIPSRSSAGAGARQQTAAPVIMIDGGRRPTLSPDATPEQLELARRLEEGERKLLAAQAQLDRMKEMTKRATANYLHKFTSKLTQNETASAQLLVPSDLAVVRSSSSSSPSPQKTPPPPAIRLDKIDPKHRASVVYTQRYLNLTPENRKAPAEKDDEDEAASPLPNVSMRTVGQNDAYLNKFLMPAKTSAPKQRRRRSSTLSTSRPSLFDEDSGAQFAIPAPRRDPRKVVRENVAPDSPVTPTKKKKKRRRKRRTIPPKETPLSPPEKKKSLVDSLVVVISSDEEEEDSSSSEETIIRLNRPSQAKPIAVPLSRDSSIDRLKRDSGRSQLASSLPDIKTLPPKAIERVSLKPRFQLEEDTVRTRRRSATISKAALAAMESSSDTFEASSEEEEAVEPVVAAAPVLKLTNDEVKEKLSLDKEVGKGAFSVVFMGTLIEEKQDVAVKVVDLSRLTQRQRNELEAERDILHGIEHDNIIKLVNTYLTGERLFLLLELVEGGDLFEQIVERGCFNERSSKHIMTQVVSAVGYLHERNIVHRDLKPENILVQQDPKSRLYHVKLADFGIAKTMNTLRLKSMCGSPGYVAPEVIKGEQYGKPVDMFAIGAITYVLLAGYPPFFGDDMQSIIEKNLKCDYDFRPQYWETRSEKCMSFIKVLLVADPLARYNISEATAHAWLVPRQRKKKQGTL